LLAGLDSKLREVMTKEIKKVIAVESNAADIDDDDDEK
jgi:hypothetical protein